MVGNEGRFGQEMMDIGISYRTRVAILRRSRANTNYPMGDHVSLLDGRQYVPRPRVRGTARDTGAGVERRRASGERASGEPFNSIRVRVGDGSDIATLNSTSETSSARVENSERRL